MRKLLTVLTCLLLFSFASKAQEWNISSGSFNALGTITATTTVDGLTIYATDAAAVTVDGNNKSVNGMDFTSRLKLGGSGTITDGAPVSRVLAFDVTGPVTVAVACMSSSSSSDRVLDLMSSASAEVLHSYTALGASISYEEYSYTGGAATLYLLSPSSGVNVYYVKVEGAAVVVNENEIVKGGDMEDPSAWNFYYNVADAVDVDGTIEFGYTADTPSAGEGGCYRVSTYGQSATFLWQKITLKPGHTYHWDGAFKNALESAPSTWLEFGIMKEQPTGGEIATGEFSYVFNLNTWMGADTLNVDTTFGEYFPFFGANSNTFKIPESETDREWFIVIKTGCWAGSPGDTETRFDFLFDNISIIDLTPNIVKGGNMEDASAWNFYYNVADAVDVDGTIEFGYTADTPSAGTGGCYRVSTYGQSATFLWQAVTLLPGHRYAFGGSFKNALGSAPSTWLEYGVMKEQPTGGEIATGEFSFVYNLNTWMGADTLNVDTTFEEYFPLSGGENGIISIPDTVSDTEWFIVIKTGCWAGSPGDTETKFDFLFDDICLYDVSVINTGGNMEDASAWKFYYNVADAVDVDGTTEFGYTADTPAAGEGGCYRVSTYGQSATFTYQAVDVIPGHRYQLTGAFKNALESAPSTWLEFGVMREEPGGGEVATSEFSFVYNLNTWMGADTLNVDTTFEEYFPFTGQKDGIFLVPDTVTDTQWYILIKTGCWAGSPGDAETRFDFLFDEIYLVDLGLEPWITLPVANIVVGEVTDAADFTASVRMKYDADSVYMIFDAVDDSIVNSGTSYQVDNIEVYFDMDNTKNIHYPRNGGWQQSIDAAYDEDDYQLRLVPGVDFATNNSARPTSASIADGYSQIYTETENGYQIILNIAWSALKPDFAAEGGTLIGFDVLWSDNDASASDANRNQITWNSPTDKPFNDPSLFGVLQLTPSGSFIALEDTEKPTAPTNLVAVADGSSITITWDASTDNRVVHQYIISDKTAVVDTIYAKASDNTYTLTNLENGSHRPGVVAVDVYGNKSSKTQTDNIDITVSVQTLVEAGYQVYPNPTSGVVRIVAKGNSNVQLAIYNLVGEKVYVEQFTEKCLLDLSAYKKGMYLLNLTSGGNTTISKLMIK